MNFFITNRAIKGTYPNETIRPEGDEHAGQNLRYGEYDIESEQFTIYKEPDNADQIVYGTAATKPLNELAGSALFFRKIYDEMIKEETTLTPFDKVKGDVLFFIHGFNTNLDGVKDLFKTLHDKYVKNKNSPIKHILIFTWPGRSPLVPYHYRDDARDAQGSGLALGRAIEKTHAFMREFFSRPLNNVGDRNIPCKRNFHLMVHSMGHQVLQHAMNCVPKRMELFKEIMLMAADIEYDIFDNNKEYFTLIDMGERIHVYYHDDDRVLDISKWTKNFNNRLGRYGRRSMIKAMTDIYDINVTHTCDDNDPSLKIDGLNHWYYYSSSEVVNDIIGIVNGQASQMPSKK